MPKLPFLLIAMTFSAFSLADSYPSKDIATAESLNDKCRNGSGYIRETMKFCTDRDALMASLKKRGWCYGNDSQSMHQRQWERCGSQKQEIVLVHMSSEDKDGDEFLPKSANLILYPERQCPIEALSRLRSVRLATTFGAQICFANLNDQIAVFYSDGDVRNLPKEFFAIGLVDDANGKVTITQPGYSYDKAVAAYQESVRNQVKKIMDRSNPDTPLPPRQR